MSNNQPPVPICVPASGESITSATVAKWHFSNNAQVQSGDLLVTLETDKVSQEVEASVSGVLEITVAEGEEVAIGATLGQIVVGAAPAAPQASAPEPVAVTPTVVAAATPAPASAPVAAPAAAPQPAAVATPAAPQPALDSVLASSVPAAAPSAAASENNREIRRKMTPLRRKIAAQLVNVQHQAAILTTFNECDMSAIMQLRKELQNDFTAKHGVKLGFMSFFVKAVVLALKEVPNLNARIEGNDIVENKFYDIGVAVGTEKGLFVPVVRDADKLGFAAIEQQIADYGKKARDGQLALADLQGGVFTITNGGIYGSLLSTPIINPPQSGILGMHAIKDRPVAVDGKVEIRPMMYLALSYDHRLVDGKDAVGFLVRVKDCLENPTRLLLEA